MFTVPGFYKWLLDINKIVEMSVYRRNVTFNARKDSFRLQPTPIKDTDLRFSLWQFFHATLQAELTMQNFGGYSDCYRALNLAMLYMPFFTINQSRNLRLTPGSRYFYKDSSSTSLAGRFGEGIAHLFMQNIGYVYWKHFDWQKRSKKPDFVFRNGLTSYALMESKGSFTNNPRLNPALKQLRQWMGNPSATRKGFAVQTYFHELSNGVVNESKIEYVEYPANIPPQGQYTNWTQGSFRRLFAGWMCLMGLSGVSKSLLNMESEGPASVYLNVVVIEDQDYAFARLAHCVGNLEDQPAGTYDQLYKDAIVSDDDTELSLTYREVLQRILGQPHQLVLGLRTDLLEKISDFRKKQDDAIIDRIEPVVAFRDMPNDHSLNQQPSRLPEPASLVQENFVGSVFHDGTMLGIIAGTDFMQKEYML